MCGDGNISRAYEEKAAKYRAYDAELLRFASAAFRAPFTSVQHIPFVLSFRGVLSSRSIQC